MARVEETQRELNIQTASAWADYADHRQRVTEFVGGYAHGLRLCVLGAGNCNDIDLSQLVPRFRHIVLVDIDAASTASAVARQPAAIQRVTAIRAPVDFSGLGELSQIPSAPSRSIARRLAESIDLEPFDFVVSPCVLSQLIGQVEKPHANEAERYLSLVQAVREVHLLLLLQLLRVGGLGVLVSDMVSTDTAPVLTSTSPQDLPALMVKLVEERNFFSGVNPFVIEDLLKRNASLTPLIARTAFHSPWLWRLNSARSYLTFAMSFQRR